KHVPIAAAGVEADEPVLPEIERLVGDRSEAKKAEARPQVPALAGNPQHTEKILAGKRREGIVRRGGKQIVVEKAEGLRPCRLHRIGPEPVERETVAAALAGLV